MGRVMRKKMTREERRKLRQKNLNRDKYLLMMITPVVIYYLIFCYFPMTGIIMAFNKYKTASGLIGIYTSEFVGLNGSGSFSDQYMRGDLSEIPFY